MLSEDDKGERGQKPLYALDKLDIQKGERQLYRQNTESIRCSQNVDTSNYR